MQSLQSLTKSASPKTHYECFNLAHWTGMPTHTLLEEAGRNTGLPRLSRQ